MLSKAVLDEYIDVLSRLGMEGEPELEELLSFFSSGFNILFTTKTPKLKIVKMTLTTINLLNAQWR